MSRPLMRARLGYALAAVALFALEAAIAIFVHDDLVRPLVGDGLVVVLVYVALRVVTPLGVVPGALAAFAVACAVEVSQDFHLVDRLGLGGSGLARAVLGTTFDPHDFLAYGAGAAAILIVERALIGGVAKHTRSC